MNTEPSLKLIRYQPSMREEWNKFLATTRNGVFLFDRNYMEYHADRFVDHSLCAYDGQRLLALLPATESNGGLVSHGGLTFGGFLTDDRMHAGKMLPLFEMLREYLRNHQLERLVYKAIPHIYHRVPSEEDLYALFLHDAKLIRRDLSSTIAMSDRVEYAKGRRGSTKKARAAGLPVEESSDFANFMALEAEQLGRKYGVKPTHTGEELLLLAARFPQNIRLFVSRPAGELLGGVVVYVSARVVHSQYIATSDRGRELGALDRIIDHLLNEVFPSKMYFDFGISTEQAGRYLNPGLVANKESYGARGITCDFYELKAMRE